MELLQKKGGRHGKKDKTMMNLLSQQN